MRPRIPRPRTAVLRRLLAGTTAATAVATVAAPASAGAADTSPAIPGAGHANLVQPAGATDSGHPAIRFGPCPDSVPEPAGAARVECGSVPVPLDARRPNGEQIRIAVSRVPATGPRDERRGALLVNPGGPGGSGLPYAVTKREKLPDPVRRSYDVIGFDPRGVGHSAPADCGEMGGLFDAPGADPVPRDRPGETAYLKTQRELARDCATGVGEALPHLSTTATAHDMDAIRAALGERRISFLGVSYGSYLGAAYAAEFPRRVDKMVLDSVVGPWDWHDFDVRQARALLRQRDTLFGWLAADDARFGLGSTAREVRSSYERVRAGLSRKPDDGFGPAEFDRAVYDALGRTERWQGLGEGLRTYLRDGSASGLRPDDPEEAFDSAQSRNFQAANRAVKCADDPGPSPARTVHDIRSLQQLDQLPVLTGLEATTCAYWQHHPEQRTPLGGSGAPPALLVASEHDPVTPIEGARQMRRKLPGSQLVTLHDDYSHGVFASRGDDCVDGTVSAYLTRGTLPDGDVHCTGPGLP